MSKYHRRYRLEGDTLVIKGVSYTVNDINKLPNDLSGENISSISDRESYRFYGRLHPFSNFYQAPFKFQGSDYHSSEQMIQHLKATYFDDEETVDQIMYSDNTLDCKRLARNISDYNHEDWCPIAKSMY